MLCYQVGDTCFGDHFEADWASDLNERKSTLGYALLLNDAAIS